MRRLGWVWWTCAGGLVLALVLVGLNRVRAGGDQVSSELVVAQNDDAGHPLMARGDEAEAEAEEREEHEKEEGKEEDEGDHARIFRFSKADLGKTPKGWTVDKTGRGEGSEWKVVADPTAPSGTGCVLAQTAKSPRRVFNLCVVDDSRYRDVEIKVCFKAVHGKVDEGGGVVWRYQDANNYYIARMNPLEENYRFYKVVNGRRTQLATKEGLKVPAGEWHTLEIECKGNRIECELDGKELLEKEDDTFRKAGKVGLWTKADAQSYFDNFKVEEEGDKD